MLTDLSIALTERGITNSIENLSASTTELPVLRAGSFSVHNSSKVFWVSSVGLNVGTWGEHQVELLADFIAQFAQAPAPDFVS